MDLRPYPRLGFPGCARSPILSGLDPSHSSLDKLQYRWGTESGVPNWFLADGACVDLFHGGPKTQGSKCSCGHMGGGLLKVFVGGLGREGTAKKTCCSRETRRESYLWVGMRVVMVRQSPA